MSSTNKSSIASTSPKPVANNQTSVALKFQTARFAAESQLSAAQTKTESRQRSSSRHQRSSKQSPATQSRLQTMPLSRQIKPMIIQSNSKRSFGSFSKSGTRQQSIGSLKELGIGPSTEKKKTLSASKSSNIVEEKPEGEDKTTLTPLMRQVLM